jgi:hypothetical protein
LVDYFDEALTQAGVDVGAIENEWLKMKDQTYCRYFSFHSTKGYKIVHCMRTRMKNLSS